ncbi:MAG: hypothetical protein LAQ69_20785 [Acidobacteriia bacterium]|nr:hypothetical protein [Terriglobia bacterium]
MTTLIFLTEWALRSAIVVLTAALLLRALRVQDPSVRLAAWSAALAGSLLIPALAAVLPGLSVPLLRTAGPAAAIQESIVADSALPGWSPTVQPSGGPRMPVGAGKPGKPFNWTAMVLLVYFLGAGALLLRLSTGLALSRRLIGRSRATGRYLPGGLPIHESADMAAPATLGILRPMIVLPNDWREWEHSKLETILAHERSHVRRRDPAVQLVSAIHRALLWYSPLSWFLHSRIVRLAEEASDDAALAAAGDRASYAAVLLDFMQRSVRRVRWEGVAMARYGKADDRINRILDGTRISRGVPRFGWAAILTLAAPLVYLAAAARPATLPAAKAALPVYVPAVVTSSLSQAPVSPVAEVASTAPVAEAAPVAAVQASAAVEPSAPAAPPAPQQSARESGGPIDRYIIVSGDSTSGSWDSRDHLPFDEWRSRFGAHFVWFRQDGQDYIVTSQQVLDELHDAMAPQREVNRMQSEVNRQQREVNRMQAGVNEQQREVNRQQDEVNRQQQEVNNRQRAGLADRGEQSRVNALQSEVNGQQRLVNQEQAKVNLEQDRVNGEQRKVNDEQRRVSPMIESAIQDILDSTIPKGLAHRLDSR